MSRLRPHLPCLFEKLKAVYEEHDSIIIALDFDDTIFDWKSKGFDCHYVINLVKTCIEKLNAKVILYTCRENIDLEFAKNYCKEQGIKLYGVNSNPDYPPTSSKMFYNIILDDKACLAYVCGILERLLDDQYKS